MSTQVLDRIPAQAGASAHADAHGHDHAHHDTSANTVYGFWIYLMSDCIIFAGLFAAFAVLRGELAGGPSAKELFELNYVLVETFILLFSSITYGMAMISLQNRSLSRVQVWLGVTFLLGLAFMAMEINEFHHLIAEGARPGPQRVPVVVLHPGRHPRPARCQRHAVDDRADVATVEEGHHSDPDQAPDLPVAVLALPGRGLDRRVYRGLPDGTSVMAQHNAPAAHGAHDSHDSHAGHDTHASFKSYAIGFILAVILTVIPFKLVMDGSMDKGTISGSSSAWRWSRCWSI